MFSKSIQFLFLFALALLLCPDSLRADLVVNNFNAQGFDNDGVGDTSSPITDGSTGTVVTFTTRFVTGGGTLFAATDELGVDRGAAGSADGDRAGFFDDGDRWSFDADQSLSLTRVVFADFSRAQNTSNEDIVLMQSNDWVGLSGVTPEFDQVMFDSGSGTFTFTAISASDGNDFDFTLSRISGGVALPISAGTDITFTDASNNTFGWQLDIMEFTTNAVPEPSSFLVLLLVVIVTVGFRRQNRMPTLGKI